MSSSVRCGRFEIVLALALRPGDRIRRFCATSLALNWLLPLKRDPFVMSALRQLLGVREFGVSRLTDDELLRVAVARIEQGELLIRPIPERDSTLSAAAIRGAGR
jgi:hypothetical protein